MGGLAEREMESYTALVGPKQDTLNKHWKQDKSSFGYRMLMKMGWSEGKGLGKTLQGSNTHIKVAKKSDSAGLGSVQDDHGNLGWSVASASFDSVLSQLNARYGGAPPKAEKEGKKSKKKKRKAEAAGDASEEEGDGLQSVLLRHPKLLKSKNIKAYSASDLSAILGVKRTETPSNTDVRGSLPAPAAEEESAAADAQGKRKKKKRREEEESEEEEKEVKYRAEEDSGEEEGEGEEERVTKKKKKGKKRRKGLEEMQEQEEEQEEKKRKRKKKKKQNKE